MHVDVYAPLTKDMARDAYRRAWMQRVLSGFAPSGGFDAMIAAEKVMDAVQADCVDEKRPGPEWKAFVSTLPGYQEFWETV